MWGKIINVVIIIGTMILVSHFVGSFDTSTWPPMIQQIWNFMPVMYVLAGVVSLLQLFMAGQEYVRIRKWKDFGNRLKLAYAAKFGGENKAFNDEVDAHIKVMRVMSKGYTKSLDEDWLKRMSRFVEVEYIIPEEEHLSEVEKTEELAKESKDLPI